MLWSLAALAAPEDGASASSTTEEITVYADLRQRTDRQTPTSTTVVDADTIQRRGATHLEEVLNTAPNVNFSSGASRARFFQIRGIGERSQFTEALNPSVGLLVDGIDMTGLGTVAGLHDVRQVEILKGPQGTLYGANALAGLISLTTMDPEEELGAEGTIGFGNYNTLETRGMVNLPLAEGVGMRIAASHLQSDGFITNEHLDRDDTQGREETNVRAKFVWEANDALTAKITGFYARANNGYDAFNFDNDRTTQSDEPGHDDQNTSGFAAELAYTTPRVRLEARSSLATSTVDYGFDEDWTYDGYHPYGYTSKDQYLRDIAMTSTEIRLLSGEEGSLFGDRTDWVVGLYSYDKRVDLQRIYTYAANDFESENRVSRWAGYGETTTRLDSPLRFTLGLRGERHQTTYTDSDGAEGDPSEWLWGGKLAVAYELDAVTFYGLGSRGYRSGGFNPAPSLPDGLRQFRTESLWNVELGAKASWLEGASRAKIAAFVQSRANVQTNGSFLIERTDGSTEFIDYTANDDAGTNLGIEAEADVQLVRAVRAYGGLGLLRARVSSPDADVDGRQQPHAPAYQATAGVRADVEVAFGGVEVEAKDAFFFSTRHDATSNAVVLLNAHAGVRVGESLELSVWGRNLTNRDVYTRGFGSFGNNPANDYETEPYYQLGEPRVFGARLTGRM